MPACPCCGTVPQENDKFCRMCGVPLPAPEETAEARLSAPSKTGGKAATLPNAASGPGGGTTTSFTPPASGAPVGSAQNAPPPVPGYGSAADAPAYGYGSQAPQQVPPVPPPAFPHQPEPSPQAYRMPRKKRNLAIVAVSLAVVLFAGGLLWAALANRGTATPPGAAPDGTVTAPGSVIQPPQVIPPVTTEEPYSEAVPYSYFSVFALGEEYYAFTPGGAVHYIGLEYPEYTQTTDGMLLYYMIRDDDTRETALYVLDTLGESRRIAPDMNGEVVLCGDGDLAFYKAGKSRTDLYCYRYSDNESALIATDVQYYVVSPDGSQVLFSNREFLTHLELGGAMQRLSTRDDPQPAAISNDGTLYVYGTINYDSNPTKYGTFFCSMEDGEQGAVEYSGYSTRLAQNRAGDDFLLLCSAGIFRYSGQGFAPIAKQADRSIRLYLGAHLDGQVYTANLRRQGYACDSFDSFFYAVEKEDSGYGLYCYLQGNSLLVDDIGSSYGMQVTQDMQSLFYSKDSDLYRADIDGGVSSQMLAENAWDYAASPDGSILYYTQYSYENGSGSTVLYRSENNISEAIAAEVTAFWIGGPGGACCTYIAGGRAYDGEAGKAYYYAPSEGSKLVADNALEISAPTASGTFFVTRNPSSSPTSSYRYVVDIAIYAGGNLHEVATQVELYSAYWNQDWFFHFANGAD